MRTRSLKYRLAALALFVAGGLGLTAFQVSGPAAGARAVAATAVPADVTVRGTLEALQKGLTKMSRRSAAENVNGWRQRLKDSERSSFQRLTSDLQALENELRSDTFNEAAAGGLMIALGEQTIAAADGPGNLQMLGQTLRQGGNKLLKIGQTQK